MRGKIFNLSSEAFWVFVGQVGAAMAGLLGIKILTRLLPAAEFGRLILANTIITFITMNFFNPFNQGVLRFWAISKERGQISIFFDLCKQFTNYILASGIIFIAMFFFLTKFKNTSWEFIIAIPLLVGIITGATGLKIAIFTAMRRRIIVAIFNVVIFLLRPLLAAMFIILVYPNANVAMFGYLLSAIIIFLTVTLLYSRISSSFIIANSSHKERSFASRDLKKEILSYSWPLFVWGIFGWIYMVCDRWALKTFFDNETVGLFAVVSQLAIWPLFFCSSFLTSLFTPIAFHRAGDLKKSHLLRSAVKILILMVVVYIAFALVLIILFSFFHESIVIFFSSTNFIKYSFLLPELVLAWALFFLGQALTTFGLLFGRPHEYIIPRAVSSVVAGVSVFYFASKFGPKGVVHGLTLSGIVYVFWCFFVTLKLISAPLKGIGDKIAEEISNEI